MTKEEYKRIIELLDEGKTEELRIYLNQRMDSRYINMVLNTIKQLIDSDCETEFPSYYQRTELHQGVQKLYKGFYSELDSGFVMCHKKSNIFELYDRSILTPKIIQSLEGSYYFDTDEKRESNVQKIKTIFSGCSKNEAKAIFSTNKEDKDIIANTMDGNELIIPSEYYTVAHNLLGEDTLEYAYKDSLGIYFSSPRGRAIVAIKKRTRM